MFRVPRLPALSWSMDYFSAIHIEQLCFGFHKKYFHDTVDVKVGSHDPFFWIQLSFLHSFIS